MSASDLDRAIEANDFQEVIRLVEAGADLRHMGDICLSMAIFKASLDILKLLIDRGAVYAPLKDYIEYAEALNSEGSHDAVIAYLKTLAA